MPTDTGLIPSLHHVHSQVDATPNQSKGKVTHGSPISAEMALQEWDSLFQNTHSCTVHSIRALQLVSSPFKAAVSDHDYCLPTPIEDRRQPRTLTRALSDPRTTRLPCGSTVTASQTPLQSKEITPNRADRTRLKSQPAPNHGERRREKVGHTTNQGLIDQ